MRRHRLTYPAVGLCLLLGGVYLSCRADTTVRDAYAAWWVADMVIEHMETRGGAWPRGWDDLREPYEACVRRAGRPWTFEELRDRVDVDWGADPARLASAPDAGTDPPFAVVRLRSGKRLHWREREPNRMILDYLRNR